MIERCWQASGDAVYFAVDILNASADGEFIKVIGHTKNGLVGFEPHIVVFGMAITKRKAEGARFPGQADIIGCIIPSSRPLFEFK